MKNIADVQLGEERFAIRHHSTTCLVSKMDSE